MSQDVIVERAARELKLPLQQAANCVALLDEGNTIPFVARYRKETTGEMDENQIRNLQERVSYLRNLEAEKEKVLRTIEEQGKLTPELEGAIRQAAKLQELEDLYRPYRPKRRTRATIAREKGLEPLAEQMLAQKETQGDLLEFAATFVQPGEGAEDAEEALAGARDIIAEQVADDARVRGFVREKTLQRGVLRSAVNEKGEPEKVREFELYHDFQEPVHRLPPHRILAINRGERLECLKVGIEAPVEEILERIERFYLKRSPSIWTEQVRSAVHDAYRRLIAPSVENEVRGLLTEKAEEQAISLFAVNLRNLLMQPPVKGLTVLGVDPGFRTGCKLAVVDETGKILDTGVIYVTTGEERRRQGEEVMIRLVERYDVDLIAIGNGTASRETEQVVAGIIPRAEHKTAYMIGNEAGASVYSASKLANEELPDFDLTLRSAVSIARRVQDPLAELVKIEPKSIGVGQCQHDVNQKRLAEELGNVVESVVNAVGVDLNTASWALLQYVAGIKPGVARAIVQHREAGGKFASRRQLLDVSGLGPKAFEQCAGFLRVPGSEEPLDNTAVHPESYPLARRIVALAGADLTPLVGAEQFMGAEHSRLRAALAELSAEKVAAELEAGLPTVRDIIEALRKPGRDPRDELPKPIFHTEVLSLEDLRPGVVMQGTVRNVVDFGAFVDIGVHQDGLVHISELSDRYVRHPSEVAAVGDIVTVRVLDVDQQRGRISLSMKGSQR